MANKMLIDATHPEETRVVVLRGSRVEEFDFESASKRQLRGNIYLAKVIRVEPSLQAAFVDYGGNRHGFLAFAEIHPDYYQIPVSDRQALLADEAHEEHDEEEERRPRRSRRRRSDRHQVMAHRSNDEVVSERLAAPDETGEEAPQDIGDAQVDGSAVAGESESDQQGNAASSASLDPTGDMLRHASEVHDAEPTAEAVAGPDDTASLGEAAQPALLDAPEPLSPSEAEPSTGDEPAAPAAVAAATVADVPVESSTAATSPTDAPSDADVDTGSPVVPADDQVDAAEGAHEAEHHNADAHDGDHHDEEEHVDQIGGDAMEEIPHRAHRSRRQYKIQEVIKRRQVLLVQVVKEERGNKGAALTTYLSLAGRYSVLMPNTARGGGISRKITDAGDRQRLKSIATELEVPDGMGVILRTAGASRTKPEVKRDFEYLMRMWETVRETTLASTAPTLVYEEGSLIKRAIRDLYNKDVEEVVVAGEDGYREAKDFMRLLMPSHARNVQPWRDPAPIFAKAGAEAQLDAMFSNHVTLKSGGYLVINQTEALVAIDVNSGRSTREHNIEDTALRTNLEAADEVARQLRLRDLAGLIVVDFIDMEEMRNNRAVERRLKDALKDDRARIQVGRISHFGLLEMSRQRIRTGVLEGSTEVCPHCAGAGTVRSTASIALHVLRVLEDALLSDASRNVAVRTRGAVALYIFNQKRAHVTELEGRFGVAISFESDEHLTGMTYCGLERGEAATGIILAPQRQIPLEEPEAEVVEEIEAEEAADAPEGEPAASEEGAGSRRRRRRRGRGRDRESSGIREDAAQPSDEALGMLDELNGAAPELLAGVSPADEADLDRGGEKGALEEGAGHEDAPDEGRGKRRRSRRGGRRARDARARHAEDGGDEGRTDAGEALELPENVELASDVAAASASPAEPASEPAYAAVATTPPPAPAQDDLAPASDGAADALPPMSEPVGGVTAAATDDGAPAEDASADGEEAASRPRRPEPVSSEADPSRPKRSGWWQRAKATLTG